ncbi:MAG: 2-hydroxyacyl-CoA dehydratase subunit D [Candidatus Hodarchaeales archaeon]|jgi:benzoyl-CoA reductase/2-hydroxyglutaryl-CoA dehydratase subunit BcrC/BadD/HgdB
MSKSSRKDLRTTALMKEVLTDYYTDFKKKGKVAWCTSVGPAELLRSFGFKVYFPENHSAILGASKVASDYIPYANAIGYSQEICSYLTADIGAFLKDYTPLKNLYGIESVPVPDVLVYNTNQCRDVQEWFMFYGRKFKVPVIGVNTPVAIGEITPYHVKAVADNMRDLVEPLEKASDDSFDMKSLETSINLSLEASILWKKVLQTASYVPAPLTFLDACVHMAPIVVLRGEQVAIDYYKALLEELEERIKDKIAAVEGESLRLYWDGMPVWGRMSYFSKLFLELRTNAVASTYCNSWIFDELDSQQPFESMARAYTQLFINRDEDKKEEYIEKMVKEFSIDGLIFHNARTCPNNSNTSYGLPTRLKGKLSIPTLSFDGDLNDLRAFSDEHTKTKFEAFIESLSS